MSKINITAINGGTVKLGDAELDTPEQSSAGNIGLDMDMIKKLASHDEAQTLIDLRYVLLHGITHACIPKDVTKPEYDINLQFGETQYSALGFEGFGIIVGMDGTKFTHLEELIAITIAQKVDSGYSDWLIKKRSPGYYAVGKLGMMILDNMWTTIDELKSLHESSNTLEFANILTGHNIMDPSESIRAAMIMVDKLLTSSTTDVESRIREAQDTITNYH